MAGFAAGGPGGPWQGAGDPGGGGVGGWGTFNPSTGGFDQNDTQGAVVTLPGGERQIVLPKLPGPFGDKIINPSLGSPDGGGVFFDPQGRDPRPGPGQILGPIGAVGPNQGTFDHILAGIKAALKKFDWPGAIQAAVKDRPRDSNGVPIVDNVPGQGVPVGQGPGVNTPGTPGPGAGTPGAPGAGGDFDGNAPNNPGLVDPTGDETVADDSLNFDFSIGRPNESNQFSSSQGQSNQFLQGAQDDLFNSLIPQFQALANQQSGQIQGMAPGLSQSLLGQGQGFLGQLGQGQNPFLQQLMQFQGANQAPQTSAGQGAFQQLAGGGGVLGDIAGGQTALQQSLQSSGPNEFLNPAIDQLGVDINQQLQRQNVGRGQDASMAGARGGSRQGVAEGIAQGEALSTFGRQAGQLRAQDAAQQRQLQQSGQLGVLQSQLQGGQLQQGGQIAGAAGLAGGGQFNAALQQQAQGQGLQALGAGASATNALTGVNQAGAVGGLGQLGNLFNVGLGQFGAARSPFESLAGLFNPTVLGSSQQAASGAGSSGGGFNFGFGVGGL